MKPVKALLFDLDGTLIDSLPDIAEAANAAVAPSGRGPFTVAQVQPHVGRGAAALLASLLEQPDPRSPDVQAAVDRFMHYYSEHLTCHTRVFPGVVEMLEHFRDLPMAVVSNKPQMLARGVVRALGLEAYFQAIYGGDSFVRKKPDPLPLLETLASWGILPADAVMVGDSQLDIEAGRRAGTGTCAVLYGLGSRDALLQAQPDELVASATELTTRYQPLC